MKTQFLDATPVIESVEKWIEVPSPPCSLVLGAACNCDLPEIERSVCQLLNRIRGSQDYRYRWLDHEDIRNIAGQPKLRNRIVERAGIGDIAHQWNDTELVVRGLASIGGLVLGGQAALDATHKLPNVCRVMLCGCQICREADLHGTVDQELCDPGQLPAEVILRFLDWMAGNPSEEVSEASVAVEAGHI